MWMRGANEKQLSCYNVTFMQPLSKCQSYLICGFFLTL